MFLVCSEIFNFRESNSAIIIMWGGIPVAYGTNVELVCGYYITEYFCRITALAVATNKAEPLNRCAPFKL